MTNATGSAATQLEIECIRREQIRPNDLLNYMHALLNELSNQRAAYRLEGEMNYRIQEEERNRASNTRLSASGQGTRPAAPACLPWPQVGPTQHFIHPQEILDWMSIPDLLSEDMRFIAERRKMKVPERDQARAEQLIRTRQIREWLTSPISAQLLVHGNHDRRAYISGLSLFCLSLTHTLGERAPQFIPLTFFCGLHVDPLGGQAHTGGRAMVQSLIGQLLERHDFSRSHLSGLDERLIRSGDVAELCKLFEMLVRALPDHVVLFCIMDGILYYEREEFKGDMTLVLITILRLSNDDSIRVPVKVLITSPTKTTEVSQPFPDNLILTMEGMFYAGMVASSSRLGREMQGGLD